MKLIIIGFLGLGLIPFFSACSTICANRVPVAAAPSLTPEIHEIVIRHSRQYDSKDNSDNSTQTNINSFHQHWSFKERKGACDEAGFPVHDFPVTTNSEIHWTVRTQDATGKYNTNSFTLIFSDTNAWTLLSSNEVWRKDISFSKANYGAVDAVQSTNARGVIEWGVSARFTNSTYTMQSKPFPYWVAVPAIRPSEPFHADTTNAVPLLMPFCFDLVDSSMVWPGDTRVGIGVQIK